MITFERKIDMLQVKQVSREIIDKWPIENSGLTARVVHSVSKAGCRNIGDLRTWSDKQIRSLRGIGKISLANTKNFFRLCGQIEQGKQTFQNIREVFAIFLDEIELKVLSARYGFDRKDLMAARDWATLQEIASAENRTRERIRQIQESGLAHLHSRLARLCLQPFVDYFARYVDSLGKVAHCADFAPLQNDPVLSGFSVCGIVLLLADLHPERISFYNGFFSTLPNDVIKQIEANALNQLAQSAGPEHVDVLAERAAAHPLLNSPDLRRRVISVVLDHNRQVFATVDARYVRSPAALQSFLVEVLHALPRPAHYRTIANAFNDRLKPMSRRGAGYVLELLNSHPLCIRADRGWYDLRTE